jgi:hypothetical protein
MRASEVEERTHKEIKELGREVMRGWAGRLAEEASNRAERAGAVRYKKTLYWHSSLGGVEVEEVRYRDRRGRQQRPFSEPIKAHLPIGSGEVESAHHSLHPDDGGVIKSVGFHSARQNLLRTTVCFSRLGGKGGPAGRGKSVVPYFDATKFPHGTMRQLVAGKNIPFSLPKPGHLPPASGGKQASVKKPRLTK